MELKNILFLNLLSIQFCKSIFDETFKEKTFFEKIKFGIIIFFNSTEKMAIMILDFLHKREISEPYDFISFFILGMIFRLLFSFVIKTTKNFLFGEKKQFVYNENDNAESLNLVIKKLGELKSNLGSLVIEEDIGNNNLIDNNIIKEDNNEVNQVEDNPKINQKLIKIDSTLYNIEKKYKELKDYNQDIYKTIEECQKVIKEALENNTKE